MRAASSPSAGKRGKFRGQEAGDGPSLVAVPAELPDREGFWSGSVHRLTAPDRVEGQLPG
jgi:hypothetical protein